MHSSQRPSFSKTPARSPSKHLAEVPMSCYVAVGQRLVVNLLTLFVAEVAAIHPVHVREGPPGPILVAAGSAPSPALPASGASSRCPCHGPLRASTLRESLITSPRPSCSDISRTCLAERKAFLVVDLCSCGDTRGLLYAFASCGLGPNGLTSSSACLGGLYRSPLHGTAATIARHRLTHRIRFMSQSRLSRATAPQLQ